MISRAALSLAVAVATIVGAPVAPARAAVSCGQRVASDFNGDGYADLAIGEPWRTVAGADAAGTVRIVYGSATGAHNTVGTQRFDQDSAGIGGAPTANDTFGLALATGFFNDDCYADLAIGTPGEDDVTILYGSATGLNTTGAIQFHGRAHIDGFGFALATGDINHDGWDDLAASAPFAVTSAGEITTLLGGPGGLAAPTAWIGQSTRGVPGLTEDGDLFGASLAIGDFDGDGFADVAVGIPGEDDASAIDAGSVTVLRGSRSGLVTTGAQLWTQDSPGLPGVVEAGDRFGFALAAGDVTGDGRADLVIGIPGEDDGSIADGGAATFLPGSATGLTATRSVNLIRSPGGAQAGDGLGIAVAIGTFDGHGDIALGIPGADIGPAIDAGAVDVIPGSAAGPVVAGAAEWTQDSTGVPGVAETGDEFGSTLFAAAIHGGTTPDLIIAAQLEDGGTTADCGSVTVLPGTRTPEVVTARGSQTFGSGATGGGPQSGAEFGASVS